MNLFKLIALFLTFLVPSVCFAQTPEDYFMQANQAYEEGDYATAAEAYRLALKEGQSANLHFNLGNTYARLRNPGWAILHYNKALAIDHGHAEAKANLARVLKEAHQSAPTVPVWQRFTGTFSLNTWAYITAFSAMAFVAFMVLPRLYHLKRASIAGIRLLILMILTCGGFALYVRCPETQAGIVVMDETPLKVAPVEHSPAVSYVQAGATVDIQRTYAQHFFVVDKRGQEGWVSSAHMKPVWDLL